MNQQCFNQIYQLIRRPKILLIYFFISLHFCIILPSTASMTADEPDGMSLLVNWSTGVDIKSNGTRWWRTGTYKCYPIFPKKQNPESYGPTEARFSASTDNDFPFTTDDKQSKTLTLKSRATYMDGETYDARSFSLILSRPSRGQISARAFDTLNELHSHETKGKCDHATYTAIVTRAVTQGHILLTYKVPKNVWLVKWNIKTKDEFKRLNFHNIEGALHVGPALNNQTQNNATEHWVWVKPGSVVTQKLTLTEFGSGHSINGSFDWEISDRPSQTDLSSLEKKISEEKYEDILNLLRDIVNTSEDQLKKSFEAVPLHQTFKLLLTLENLLKIARPDNVWKQDIEDDSSKKVKMLSNISWDLAATIKLSIYLVANEFSRQISDLCSSNNLQNNFIPSHNNYNDNLTNARRVVGKINSLLELSNINESIYFLDGVSKNLTQSELGELFDNLGNLSQFLENIEQARNTFKLLYESYGSLKSAEFPVKVFELFDLIIHDYSRLNIALNELSIILVGQVDLPNFQELKESKLSESLLINSSIITNLNILREYWKGYFSFALNNLNELSEEDLDQIIIQNYLFIHDIKVEVEEFNNASTFNIFLNDFVSSRTPNLGSDFDEFKECLYEK